MAQIDVVLMGDSHHSSSLWRRALRSLGPYFPLVPVLVYLAGMYVWPLMRMIGLSLRYPEGGSGLGHFIHFFRMPLYPQVLLQSVKVSLIVCLACIALGYPVAYLLYSTGPRTRFFLTLFVIIPFLVSTLVRTYSWMVLLGRSGLINSLLQFLSIVDTPVRMINTDFAVYVGMTHVLLPFAILSMYSVMMGIDWSLVKAAESLGAAPRQAFLKVFLPLSLPGVASGALLVFIMAMGFYITPALLGSPNSLMIAQLVDVQVKSLGNWEFGSAAGTVLLIATLTMFWIYNRFLGLDHILEGL